MVTFLKETLWFSNTQRVLTYDVRLMTVTRHYDGAAAGRLRRTICSRGVIETPNVRAVSAISIGDSNIPIAVSSGTMASGSPGTGSPGLTTRTWTGRPSTR